MARVVLGEGRDVVVPQFLGRAEFIGELEALAAELGVEFVEVVARRGTRRGGRAPDAARGRTR